MHLCRPGRLVGYSRGRLPRVRALGDGGLVLHWKDLPRSLRASNIVPPTCTGGIRSRAPPGLGLRIFWSRLWGCRYCGAPAGGIFRERGEFSMVARFGFWAVSEPAGVSGWRIGTWYGAACVWALPRIREAHSPNEMLRASADRLDASARVGSGGLCALMAGGGWEGGNVSSGVVGELREDCGRS